MRQLDVYANTKVKKNRVMPVLILMTIIMIAMFIISSIFLVLMLTLFSDKQNESYDELATLSARSLNLELDKTFDEMEDFIEGYASEDFITLWRSQTMANDLKSVKSYNNYKAMYLVDLNGEGFNQNFSAIDISAMPFFKRIRADKKVVLPSDDKSMAFYYCVPLMDSKGSTYGYFIVVKSSVIDKNSSSVNMWSDSTRFYILDMNNEVVGMSYYGSIDFNFDGVDVNTIYDPTAETSFFSVASDFIDGNNKLSATENDGRGYEVWHLKDLKYNNWRLCVGHIISNTSNTENGTITTTIWTVFGIQFALLFFMLALFTIMQIRSNHKLIAILHLDPITGYTNWMKFKADTAKLLRTKRRSRQQRYYVTFNIMQFNVFSDMYGYEQSNQLLIYVSGMLQKWIKPGEIFTRHNSDRFAVLIYGKNDDEVEKRLFTFEQNLRAMQGLEGVKLIFGIYGLEDRQNDPEKMDIYANIAKDTVSPTQVPRIAFYDENMRKQILKEKDIESTMEQALENHEFVVYLQPKFGTVSETISGAEALVRWISPDKGFVSPGEFIPLFEKNGFIVKLDYYMLNSVCALQKRWLEDNQQLVTISVNISRANFSNPTLAERIKEIVDHYGVPYKYIELELTESAFFDDKSVLLNTVKKLRDFGFPVSMDDFGAGYSSLNSLKDLPLDVIKLDAEFFRGNDDFERGKTVIQDTIVLAKDLKMKVVAEGIETREQVDFLGNLGCDLIQGFYFSKPLPVSDFEKLQHYSEESVIPKNTEEGK